MNELYICDITEMLLLVKILLLTIIPSMSIKIATSNPITIRTATKNGVS